MATLTDTRLAVQRDLSRVLASARQLNEAAPLLLDAMSRHLDCVVSELWVVDKTRGALQSAGVWARSNTYRSFLQTAESFTFARGRGLPGLVWERETPQWIQNVTEDPAFERAVAANACGLRAAVAFPILFGGKVTGVVQFFYEQALQADAAMMEMFADVGEQLGLFLERARADAIAMRQAAELVELSAPILRVAKDAILLPIIGTIDARRGTQMLERLLTHTSELGARVVVLDLTSAGTIDTYMARQILDAAAAVSLLGSRTILTGVQPSAARTLALLGIDLEHVDVCSTLADGLAALR